MSDIERRFSRDMLAARLLLPTIEHAERDAARWWGAPVRFEGEERARWVEWLAKRDACTTALELGALLRSTLDTMFPGVPWDDDQIAAMEDRTA